MRTLSLVLWPTGGKPLPKVDAAGKVTGETRYAAEGKLARYKYPHCFEFVAELPKTATGKIQRYKLREREPA